MTINTHYYSDIWLNQPNIFDPAGTIEGELGWGDIDFLAQTDTTPFPIMVPEETADASLPLTMSAESETQDLFTYSEDRDVTPHVTAHGLGSSEKNATQSTGIVKIAVQPAIKPAALPKKKIELQTASTISITCNGCLCLLCFAKPGYFSRCKYSTCNHISYA